MRLVRTVLTESILFVMQRAFEGSNVLALANKITKDPVPDIPSKYPKEMFSIICELLQKDPERRPSPRQIL